MTTLLSVLLPLESLTARNMVRAKEICAKLKDFFVSGWIGEVETQSSNSDGLGVLSIRIADGISIKTWNNKISDFEDKTLIEPEDAVFKQAVALTKGQKVTFGGQFFRDPTDCIRESSLTLKGSLTQPEFIFRFSSLAPGWVAPKPKQVADLTVGRKLPHQATEARNSAVSCNPWPAKCGIPVQDVTELVDWHWRPEPAFASTGAILWDVKIRNTSSQNMGWVQVKFFAYDANGNYVTTDDATVFSIPPGETRSAKGYADLHGTEATATVQLQEFLFVAEDMTAGLKLEDEEKTADEMLAFRKLNHFCRVEQALKDKVAITAKSLKQRWPQDQDCRDGYELHACFQQVSDDWVRKSSAFMDSCKQKGTADQCARSIGASPLLSEATAALTRCQHLTYHH
jgi:hypothetical protein